MKAIRVHAFGGPEVLTIEDVPTPRPAAGQVLIRVKATNGKRAEVLQLCEVFRARVVDVAPESLCLEITGTQDKIDSLVEVLRPVGILEMVRTGAVAMLRGTEAAEAHAPDRHIEPHIVAA